MTSPGGHDIDDTAQLIVDGIVDSVFHLLPVECYDQLVWWRQVLLVAAQKLTVESGFPLMALNQNNLSHRGIAAMLAEDGISLSPAGVGDLIRAAKVAQSR